MKLKLTADFNGDVPTILAEEIDGSYKVYLPFTAYTKLLLNRDGTGFCEGTLENDMLNIKKSNTIKK